MTSRLQTISYDQLRAEHASLLERKYALQLVRERSPLQNMLLNKLQRGVDQMVAEMFRRKEAA